MKILFYKKNICIFSISLFVVINCNAQTPNQSSISETGTTPSIMTNIPKKETDQIKSELQKAAHRHNHLKNKLRRRSLLNRQIAGLLPLSVNETSETNNSKKIISRVCPPSIETNFAGNPLTPFYLPPIGYYASESSIAISNAGKIVSLSNGWIRYYNENGKLTFSDSLYHFCSGLIDVRVVYDPKKDRFVFISSYGFTDFNTVFESEGLVVAFSKSNDPKDGWNFYYFPDSEVGDNNSIDYPQLGITDNEIFITEFRTDADGNIINSIILQLDKHDGYSGAPLVNTQIFPVLLSGDYAASVVPASGGSTTYGPNMYFVMADETGSSDDLYYVFEVTNTIASGKAVLETYGSVHSGESYSPAPLSFQPGHIPLLEQGTEGGGLGFDDFLQNAFFENGSLQFSQNSAANRKGSVCVGRISGIPTHLSCNAQTISDPHLTLLFPQIVYTGNSHNDNSAMIGIEYTGEKKYPGLEAVSIDNYFSISQPTKVKEGEDTIDGLWGDYSALCRRYNHPGECWIEGQYGSRIFPDINWIAKLQSWPCSSIPSDGMPGEKNISLLGNVVSVFPNPVSRSTTISFSLNESQHVSIQIFDTEGKLVRKFANEQMQAGAHQIVWNATDEKGNMVNTGFYFLKMQLANNVETKKIVVVK